MSPWTVEKFIAALRRYFHDGNPPDIPKEILDHYRKKQPFSEADMLDLLENVYDKEEEKFSVYGSFEEVFEHIKLLDKMPEVIRYSDNWYTQLSEECIETSNCFKLEDEKNIGYYSKLDVARFFFNDTIRTFRNQKIPDLSMMFYIGWLMSLFNSIREDLKGLCEYVPETAWLSMESDIKMFKCKPSYRFRNSQIRSFLNLRLCMDERYSPLLVNPMECLKTSVEIAPVNNFQSFYSYAFTCAEQMIEQTKQVYTRYMEVFKPFPKPRQVMQIHCKWQLPIIRLFTTGSRECYLAREVRNAVEMVMKLRYPKLPFPQDLIRVESEEEKKNGFVYSLSSDKFEQILRKVGLTKKDFCICTFPLYHDFDFSFLPILSAGGAHCKPAYNIFDYIIYYIACVLKCFQSDEEHIEKTLSWIDKLDTLFTAKDNLYFLEMWRVSQLIEQARKELTPKSNKHYRVPKRNYKKESDVLSEIQMMAKNIPLGRHHLENAVYILRKLNSKGYCSRKDVFYGYSQAIKIYIMLRNGNLGLFFENQATQFKQISTGTIELDMFIEELAKQMKKPEKKEIIEIKLRNSLEQGKDLSEITKYIDETHHKLTTLIEDNEKLKKSKEDLKRELRDSCNTMKKQVADHKFQINQLEKTLEKGQCSRQDIKTMQLNHKQEVENVEKELKMKIEKLETECKNKTTNERNLQAKIRRHETDLDNKRTMERQLQEKIQNLNNQNVQKTNQIKELKNKMKDFDEMKIELKKLRSNESAKAKELKSVSECLNRLQNEMYHLVNENERLTLKSVEEHVDINQKIKNRMAKYEQYMRMDFHTLLATMRENLTELIWRFPLAEEYRLAREEVLQFEPKLVGYLGKVRQDYWKMRDHPNISIGELNSEIEMFPNEAFIKKYEEWIKNLI